MTEPKNNNSFLRNTKALILIAIAIASIAWGISATVHSTQAQVIDLKAQQETFVSREVFDANLAFLNQRFGIMEKQLNEVEDIVKNIERLLLEQKK